MLLTAYYTYKNGNTEKVDTFDTASEILDYTTDNYDYWDAFFIVDWENKEVKSSDHISDLIDFDLIATDIAENDTFSHYFPDLS